MVMMPPPSDERQPLIHRPYNSESSTNPFHEKLGPYNQEIKPVNAQPSDKHIFSPRCISGDPVKLMIYKENGEYRVMKDIHETIFTVKSCGKYLHNLLVLLDPKETPVALLENVTSHDRWDVSAITGTILCSEKIFSASGDHTAVNVSLEDESSCLNRVDFQIKWLDKTCIIYKGDSSKVIAKMHPLENGDKFSVTVYHYMNAAFVVTLFVIVDAMKISESVVSPPMMGQPSDESVHAPLIMPQSSDDTAVRGQLINDVSVSSSDVIGLKYTSDALTALIFEKTENSSAGEYYVSKAESREERMFIVKSHDTIFHSQLKLLDEDGIRIAMLRKKNMTGHARWVVSRVVGENEVNLEKAYSVCKSHMIQRQMDLNVILEKECSAADFKVVGSWTDKTCVIKAIYNGDSSKEVAKMRPVVNENDKFKVEVYPNVDCAFVVSLIAVVDAIKSYGKLKVAAGRAASLAVKLAVGAAAAAAVDCI